MDGIWPWSLGVLGLAFLLSLPAGSFLAEVMGGARSLALTHRLPGLIAGPMQRQQTWREYLRSLLLCSLVTGCMAAFLLASQHWLPGNPDAKGPLEWSLVFHTAASFLTTTDLQHYAGEDALSFLSQTGAITWLMFLGPALGLSALAQVIRSLTGNHDGNFYRDLCNAVVWVLLPLSLGGSLCALALGVPMSQEGALEAVGLGGAGETIFRGLVASQLAIAHLGANGGGWFGANMAHPFQNPSWLSQGVFGVLGLLIPFACIRMFAVLTGRRKEARMIAALATLLLVCAAWAAGTAGAIPNPALGSGANLEGTELRLGGAVGCGLWTAFATMTGNGSLNCSLDSAHPLVVLTGLVGMWMSATLGGAGTGMLSFFIFILMATFLAGMMVGKTPEYQGFKVEAREMKIALAVLLLPQILVLVPAAALVVLPGAIPPGGGHHRITQVIYELSSHAANNGSSMAGLSSVTPLWNVLGGVVALLGRFVPIAGSIAAAASLGGKSRAPQSAATLSSDNAVFGTFLLAVVAIVGGLLFLPAAVLGSLGEALLLSGGL